MTKFQREEDLVKRLLERLGRTGATTHDPNTHGHETGIDVVICLDNQKFGVQVTELDPYSDPGKARAEEKAVAGKAPGEPYPMWVQNNPSVVLDAFVRTIERKVGIAAGHSFEEFDEIWLLICAGIPGLGTVGSTFVLTPELSPQSLNSATDEILRASKYDRCFFLPIMGVERALYRWDRNLSWEKTVTEERRVGPSPADITKLMKAGAIQALGRSGPFT